jgi:hypothetical protein
MSTRSDILALIAIKEAQLASVRTAYTEATTSIEKYSFSSGTASQSVSRKTMTELSAEEVRLQNEITALYRRLNGGSLVSTNLRRHN